MIVGFMAGILRHGRRRQEAADMSDEGRDSVPADALVCFGITGDLAHKMILPALYAMVKHGTLQVPVIGVAFSHWDLARPARACPGQHRQDRRHRRPAGPGAAAFAVALPGRRLQRSGHVSAAEGDAGRGPAARLLPGHSAGDVRHGHPGAGGGGPGRRRPRHRREALRPRPGLGANSTAWPPPPFPRTRSSASITSSGKRRS